MLVQRTPIPPAELRAFQAAIVASGRDPAGFHAEMFEPGVPVSGEPLRRVHVVGGRGAALYDACCGAVWTESFARHLARGLFG